MSPTTSLGHRKPNQFGWLETVFVVITKSTVVMRGKMITARRIFTPVSAVETQHRVRSFFASSTDHTRLLAESEVHRLKSGETETHYILAPGGTSWEIVQKVPPLHLARLTVRNNETIMNAKVVTRTLGNAEAVCQKLLDAALSDIAKLSSKPAHALSTIHGVSSWAEKSFQSEDPAELDVVRRIASGDLSALRQQLNHQSMWEKVCLAYVSNASSCIRPEDEVLLYLKNGAKIISIEHLADVSDYADQCGGAMALLAFNK
jgi:hypothetical protein